MGRVAPFHYWFSLLSVQTGVRHVQEQRNGAVTASHDHTVRGAHDHRGLLLWRLPVCTVDVSFMHPVSRISFI